MKSTPKRSNPEERKQHFLTVWVDDPTIKLRLVALADAEGRSTSNYFNRYMSPLIDGEIDKKWAALPAATRRELEAKYDAALREVKK